MAAAIIFIPSAAIPFPRRTERANRLFEIHQPKLSPLPCEAGYFL